MIAGICIASFFFVLYYLSFAFKINWIRDLTAQDRTSAARYRASKNRKIGKLPPVYPNGWFGLLDSSELKSGQVKHVTALGQNFAVFRTASGKARVLNAYCPHLGANMAEGGVVMGEELECPFHLWRFCGESGKCTSIPYSAKVPVNARTKSWECVERNRVIFVWYHAEGAPPDWWPNAIPEIASNAWSYHGRNEFYINCHIQEIPENGADWAHLNSLHGPCVVAKDVFSRFVRHSWTEASWSTNFRDEPADDEKQKEAEEVVRSDEAAEDQADRHRAVSLLRHELLLLGRYRLMKLNVVADQIGPGYVELRLATTFGPLCIVQTVTPVEPLVQRVTHLIFSPQLLAPYAKLVMLGECLQFERDARIWNRKKYLDRPVLVRDECTINVYRRWYRQFYSENSPTYESCKDGLDW